MCPPDSVTAEAEPSESSGQMEELRSILLRGDESYLTETVKSVLAEATVLRVDESKEQMAAALAPLMGDAIRQQILTAQDDIVDALYPVIGKAIQRSVAEAMRALARRVDEGLRNTLSARRVLIRIRARLQGIPESELLLREALPFQIQEMFLIHRGSGLLLEHLSRSAVEEPDRDLVSSMLTAIRDFAQDTFGTDREGELDQIQYGSASILIAPGPWAYLAAVVDGVEPAGFRDEMRSVLSDVHRAFSPELQAYEGDSASLTGVADLLKRLLTPDLASPLAEPPASRRGPWLAIASAGAMALLCVAVACFAAWRLTWGRPTPAPTETAVATVAATATWTLAPTDTPSPTPTHTATATSVPSPTPTFTPTVPPTAIPTATPPPPTLTATPAPIVAVMIGNVWLRAEPRDDSPLTGQRVEQGRPVEILAIFETWYQIRWPPLDETGTAGWVPGRWVGMVSAPPAAIITPAP